MSYNNNNNTGDSDFQQSSSVSTNYAYSRAPTDKVDPIVSFSSADNAWRNDILSSRDPTFDVGYRADADLSQFLQRPIKIQEFTWNVNGGIFESFDPWTLFLANTNVLRRIENYHLLRGDLDLKFMLNGNGFYYGRVIVDYNPLKPFRIFDEPFGSSLALMQATQRPHAFLDPSTSTGAEMSIPYFYPKNWIDLTGAEYSNLGVINLESTVPLRQANSGTGSITISVFASMKNVMLTIPTVNPVGSISPQGGHDTLSVSSDDTDDTPTRFASIKEKDDFLQAQAIKRARELAAEDDPRSRICSDPIAVVAAVLAGIGAAGFAREINTLRARAREIESTLSKNYPLDTISDDDDIEDQLQGLEYIKPESGKGNGKKSSAKGSTHSGSTQKGDEYGDGIISKPASILAKMAGSITNVPVIGKYALASKFALEGVANVSRIFGYSRPPIVENIQPVKIHGAGLMANTDADEVVAKLTLDTKQELSIDPSTVGLEGTDQMALAHVCQKESFLETFSWTEEDNVEDLLFNMHLTPTYFNTLGNWGTTGKAVCTPMTHAAQMFQWWRGSITVRFQIVASQFHKGRIRITYDPLTTNVFSTDDYNIAYNRVIDLAEDRDFEITYRWSQAEAWKQVLPIQATLPSVIKSETSTLNPLVNNSNGMLQVSVVNSLTTPNPTVSAPITVNVYVRAGDDFELAGPTNEQLRLLTYNDPTNGVGASRLLKSIKPQSGKEEDVDCNEATDNGLSAAMDNSPEVVDSINAVGGDAILDSDMSLHVFMGEKVASYRQLMKRYNFHDAIQIPAAGDVFTYTTQRLLNFPEMRGAAFQARTTDGTDPYNYTHMTYMNWIVPCYAGWRGGIRRKAQAMGALERINLTVARRSRAETASNQILQQTDIGNQDANTLAFQMVSLTDPGMGGAYTNDGTVNPTIEYELPFYSDQRFAHTQSYSNSVSGTRVPNGYMHNLEYSSFGTSQATGSIGLLKTSVATGEDFSCFWFLNVPTIYNYSNPDPGPPNFV